MCLLLVDHEQIIALLIMQHGRTRHGQRGLSGQRNPRADRHARQNKTRLRAGQRNACVELGRATIHHAVYGVDRGVDRGVNRDRLRVGACQIKYRSKQHSGPDVDLLTWTCWR